MQHKRGVGSASVGVIMSILAVVLILAVIGITQTYTSDITQDVREDYYSNTANCNSTHKSACGPAYDIANDSLNTQIDISEKIDNVGNVYMAGAIIAVLIAAFGFVLGRKMGYF